MDRLTLLQCMQPELLVLGLGFSPRKANFIVNQPLHPTGSRLALQVPVQTKLSSK